MGKCEICNIRIKTRLKSYISSPNRRLCRNCIFILEINPYHLFPADERANVIITRRNYYLKNKKRIYTNLKIWRSNNLEKISQYNERYRERKKVLII